MSSLFGQVWLWSLLSFVAGVALTWFVLVRPAKKELEDLEERLLTSPRPASGSSASSAASKADAVDEFDNWHVEASRSLADDVLTPEPARYEVAAERPRFEAAPEPVRYDVSNMKLDQRDSLLEELDDEHRPLSDFEEQHDFPELDAEPPRSLFDRLAPGADTRETLEPRPRPRPHQPEDEPELPAEATTHLMPAVPSGPVAEVAPRQEEPTAPPEVEVFQPREVWREEPVKEVYDEDVDTAGHEEEDEPERRPGSTETTALIPATALAQAIAEVDGEQRGTEEPEPQVWPEHDLTGHFAPVEVESARSEPATAPTSSDEAFLNDLARQQDGRQDEARPPAEPRPAESREDEGPQTDIIRAVADPRPAEPEAEPTREAEPEPAEPEAVTPEAVRPEVVTPEPEPRPEPPAFEPTFVPQSADQPLPARQPEPKAEPKKDEPARPRSLFEPLEDDEQVPELEQRRPAPSPSSSGNDQPFVPTLSPELLAGNPVPMNPTGLPQRPTRPAGAPRTPPPAPLSSPKPVTPPPPRPVRPRPVGFSPSTGGRPAPGSTRFQGQQEGFNPRSPFGPGSVLPKSDGLAPAPEFQVKATLTGRRYFTNESANFRETRADVWFRTTADAEKAGFRQAP
ncbi:hypothetical protein ACIQMJ_07705 [Actinosynnema sp. NPDC091369]